MTDLDKLQKVGKQVEARLVEIREGLGASLGNSSVDSSDIDVTGGQLQKLAETNPGRPIIINGTYHFAYIKDHYFHGRQNEHVEVIKSHPSRCFVNGNKVHFYYCQTLAEMKERGRQMRYRATSSTASERKIDFQDAADVPVRLALCKFCIGIFGENCGIWGASADNKSAIAEYANFRELMDCVKACYNGEAQSRQKMHAFWKNTIQRRRK